ncbi:MAG TPA: transcriptional regulator, partial [Clostridia bacterium]|nr:transcriptional regulator [Clostridia bacterium]
QSEHPDLLEAYFAEASRYVGLTEHQRGFLTRIRRGHTDQDIAQSLGLSPSTVRHQRFTLREKAKQAKLYLALYTLAMQGSSGEAEAHAS